MKVRILRKPINKVCAEYIIQRRRWYGWTTIQLYKDSLNFNDIVYSYNTTDKDIARDIAIEYARNKGIIKYKGYTIDLVDIHINKNDVSERWFIYAILGPNHVTYRKCVAYGTLDECKDWIDSKTYKEPKRKKKLVYLVEGFSNSFTVYINKLID